MKKPESFWKKKLSKEQYHVLREKGTEIPESTIPESFKVLVKELNGLCLKVELLGAQMEEEKAETEKELKEEEKIGGEAKALAQASGEKVVAEGQEISSVESSISVDQTIEKSKGGS